jgi:hypothetical protein
VRCGDKACSKPSTPLGDDSAEQRRHRFAPQQRQGVLGIFGFEDDGVETVESADRGATPTISVKARR